MEFVKRLIELRKQGGLTQQEQADAISLHLKQIKRFEAGTAQPTLDTLVGLAKGLHTTLDDLVFGQDRHEPTDDLRLQFVALSQFDKEELKVAKAALESPFLKHNAKRAFADQIRDVK